MKYFRSWQLGSRKEFQKRVMGGPEGCQAYWSACIREAWFELHPAKDRILAMIYQGAKTIIALVRIYGDDVEEYKGQKCLVLNWCGCAAMKICPHGSHVSSLHWCQTM
jgi:hypothetical protein